MITDPDIEDLDVLYGKTEMALKGGVDAVMLRRPNEPQSARLLSMASYFREMTHRYRAKLIIHRYYDLVEAVDADGVHVPSAMLQAARPLRSMLGGEKSISASCHDVDELKEAEKQGCDFVFLSPVFATESHPGQEPLGVGCFFEWMNQISIPVMALGGIHRDNCEALKHHAMVMMRGVYRSDDPEQQVRAIKGMAIENDIVP